MPPRVRKYHREDDVSYAVGGYAVVELLRCRPRDACAVWLRSDFRGNRGLIEGLCRDGSVPLLTDDRVLSLLSPKENVYAAAQFRKPRGGIDERADHLVLVRPGDMGNLGTILREAAGFGVRNIALLSGGADEWSPKVVRASMGACFRVRTERFGTLEEYLSRAGDRDYCCFRLNGEETLSQARFSRERPTSLLFGNEASGLPPEYTTLGRGIVIRHSGEIDSLNLSVAVGIVLYAFSQSGEALFPPRCMEANAAAD